MLIFLDLKVECSVSYHELPKPYSNYTHTHTLIRHHEAYPTHNVLSMGLYTKQTHTAGLYIPEIDYFYESSLGLHVVASFPPVDWPLNISWGCCSLSSIFLIEHIPLFFSLLKRKYRVNKPQCMMCKFSHVFNLFILSFRFLSWYLCLGFNCDLLGWQTKDNFHHN